MSPEVNERATTIRSGSGVVLASGTVIGLDGNPIEITTYGITIVVQFVEEQDQPQFSSRITSEGQRLSLFLINFASPLGAGTIKPFVIGAREGNEVVLQLRAYPLAKAPDYLLHYTIYQRDKLEVK